jgi:hypothetical protein
VHLSDGFLYEVIECVRSLQETLVLSQLLSIIGYRAARYLLGTKSMFCRINGESSNVLTPAISLPSSMRLT